MKIIKEYIAKCRRARRIRRIREMLNCKYGHNFSQWVDISAGNIKEYGAVTGYFIKQEKRCFRCNLVHLRCEMTPKRELIV